MLFDKQQNTIEEYLLPLLKQGSMKITDVVEHIQRSRPQTTKQGVYYTIRILKKAEVVVTHKKMISLNAAWLKQLSDFTAVAEHYYLKTDNQSGSFLKLNDKEKIQYHFKNPVQTDTFWNHAIFQIASITAPNEPFIAYNPHCWFYIAHPENEIHVRDLFAKSGRQYFITAHHNTPLDQSIHQYFDTNASQYYIRKTALFDKEQYYLNVIGDFIIEVWIDPFTSDRINAFYACNNSYTQDTRHEFRKIVEDRGRTKLTISRNERKAEQLKKRLVKPFWLRKAANG